METTAILSNSITTPSHVLDSEIFHNWISYLDASERTVETYQKCIKQFALFLIDKGIQKPTRDDIIEYREKLKESHKPTTVQIYITAVKLFFQWTEQEGIYPNIAVHVKGAKIDTEHKKDYLTSKQTVKLLGTVDTSDIRGLRDYAILALMVTTGLRTVSVIRANVSDIRPVGDDIALYYQGKGHEEKAEYVKLSEPVENAIREYLNARGISDVDEPLFQSIANRNDGERMTTRSISRIVKERLNDADLVSDRLTAHSLRHTTATLNLLNGATLEETQQLLGHSSINTTMIYAHALERAKNESEKRVSKAIFG